MSWEDKTSDAYWTPQPGAATWNGSGWDSVMNDATLLVIGDWATGYNPLYIRITTLPAMVDFTFYLLTNDGAIFQDAYSVDSGESIQITFSGEYNIISLRVLGTGESFSITKIEFLVADAVAPDIPFGGSDERVFPRRHIGPRTLKRR